MEGINSLNKIAVQDLKSLSNYNQIIIDINTNISLPPILHPNND